MKEERKRQPTLLLPQGLSGLLMFTSRISIKMGGGVCLCVYMCVILQLICVLVSDSPEKKGSDCICVHACNW